MEETDWWEKAYESAVARIPFKDSGLPEDQREVYDEAVRSVELYEERGATVAFNKEISDISEKTVLDMRGGRPFPGESVD